MQILRRMRERCTLVIPPRTRAFGWFQRGFCPLLWRTGEIGENCSLRETSLSMNLTSAIGISTYTTAKIFMCLLAWCTSVVPLKLVLTTKHMVKQFARSVWSMLPLGGQSPSENWIPLQMRLYLSYILSRLAWAWDYGSTNSNIFIYIQITWCTQCIELYLYACKPTYIYANYTYITWFLSLYICMYYID